MPASALMNVMIAAARKAGPQPRARLRRGRAAAGLGQGARQFRLRRRPQGRGDHLPRAVEGAARLRLPDGGARRGRRRRQDATAGSSIRSTAPPTSCTASRCSPSRSALERDGELVAGVVYNPIRDELSRPRRARAPSSTTRRLRVAARKTLADASSRPASRTAAAPATRASCARCKAVMRAGRRHPPHRLGRARSRLGRRRPLRRLLGARPAAVGHGGRHRPGARGRRHRHRPRRRRQRCSRPASVVAANSTIQKALLALCPMPAAQPDGRVRQPERRSAAILAGLGMMLPGLCCQSASANVAAEIERGESELRWQEREDGRAAVARVCCTGP